MFVSAFVKKYEWTCEVATVPDALDNPLVAELGILSADFTPNIFLLRPDGSISWSIEDKTERQLGGSDSAGASPRRLLVSTISDELKRARKRK